MNISKKKDSWYQNRGYRHFDRPMTFASAIALVENPDRVQGHAFLPFVSYETEQKRYVKDKNQTIKKLRRVAYASHSDSHIFSYYGKQLSRLYEERLVDEGLERTVLAYRRLSEPKSNIDFAERAFSLIRGRCSCIAVGLDLESFFDTLPHHLLKSQWASLLGVKRLPPDHFAVYKALTRWSYVDRSSIMKEFDISKKDLRSPTPFCSPQNFRERLRDKGEVKPGYIFNRGYRGIPQGSPMSGLASNIAFLPIDKIVHECAVKLDVSYLRYSDDVLLIGSPDEVSRVQALLTSTVELYGMKINPDKTVQSNFWRNSTGNLSSDKPLQYLGFLFDGQRVLVRSQTVARSIRKMKRGVRAAKLQARRSGRLYKYSLYGRYSHLGWKGKGKRGRSNFWTYAMRAHRKMEQSQIKRQLRRHWTRLNQEIKDT